MTEESKTSGFRSTLRRLATEGDATERLRVAELFASQIELALDTQGGNMQVALWNVEEGVAKKIDHIHEQLGNANTLQSAVLEAVNGLRGDVQQTASEMAARLGKNEDAVTELRGLVSDLGESQSEFRADLSAMGKDVGARFERLETRVDTIEHTVARIELAMMRSQMTLDRVDQWTEDHPVPDELRGAADADDER